MVLISIGLSCVFGMLAVGLRAWVHARRTGTSPFRSGAGIGAPAALVASAAALLAGPIADLLGAPRLVHGSWVAAIGLLLAAVGLALTLWSQLAMGEDWRIGVDPTEHTGLVTGGPFGVVRNPIYTAMAMFATGLVLVVPNVASLLALAGMLVTLELHVRQVEEPHLVRHHGDDYRSYAARVGRFVPAVGRQCDFVDRSP
jgi:protein-S-isoprenylcysteine O-methyltransferase Ste14